MHGRLRALVLIVGLVALPLQARPAHAESCDLVGSDGSFSLSDGSGANRSWRINIEGVTYQSDVFDELRKESRKKIVKVNGKKARVTQNVFVLRDSQGITRTPNGDVTKSVDATIKGEINETDDSGEITVKDRTFRKTLRIIDVASGLPINCG